MIRRAGPGDATTLAALRRRWGDDDDASTPDPGFEASFASWLEGEAARRVFWLAFADDEPVGMANLVEFTRMPRAGRPPARWGYLGNAFVVPEHRDRGIGSALLAAVLGHARERGHERIVLNPTARSVPFYERHGFRPASDLLRLDLSPPG